MRITLLIAAIIGLVGCVNKEGAAYHPEEVDEVTKACNYLANQYGTLSSVNQNQEIMGQKVFTCELYSAGDVDSIFFKDAEVGAAARAIFYLKNNAPKKTQFNDCTLEARCLQLSQMHDKLSCIYKCATKTKYPLFKGYRDY